MNILSINGEVYSAGELSARYRVGTLSYGSGEGTCSCTVGRRAQSNSRLSIFTLMHVVFFGAAGRGTSASAAMEFVAGKLIRLALLAVILARAGVQSVAIC